MRLSADPDASLMRGQFRPLASRRVLGLDPGKTTGWAIYDPDSADARCGVIDLRHCGDLGEMLSEYREALEHTLIAARPCILAVERPFGRRGFTADLPGILCGLAHMIAFDFGVERREFSASSVKKGVTGNGRASKAEVIAAVTERYGFQPPSDHAADAAAVAILAWAREAQK